jgi:phosphatidate cytidylyltransferase
MNLALRVVSGAVLLAIVAGALWLGTAPVAALVGLAALVAVWEYAGLATRLDVPPPPWLLYPLALWLALRVLFPSGYTAADWPLYAAVVLGLLGCVAFGVDFRRWASAVGGAVWIGLSLGAFLAVYRWPAAAGSHLGLRLVGLALAGVIAGDIAAYAAGTAFGRHRFFPTVSPRKSVEGAIAGLLAAVAIAAALAAPLAGIAWWLGAVLGVLVAIAAQGGDLVESALKRRAGVKDSSQLIPGHGGLLDRIDSLLLVGPLVYCYFKLVLP